MTSLDPQNPISKNGCVLITCIRDRAIAFPLMKADQWHKEPKKVQQGSSPHCERPPLTELLTCGLALDDSLLDFPNCYWREQMCSDGETSRYAGITMLKEYVSSNSKAASFTMKAQGKKSRVTL